MMRVRFEVLKLDQHVLWDEGGKLSSVDVSVSVEIEKVDKATRGRCIEHSERRRTTQGCDKRP